MENQMQIITSEAVEAINRSEVDVSIATAKKFPRDVKRSIDECLTVATMTKQTAEECFYALPRGGKVIEGPSVRLAEILVHSWGNINSGFRIIGNDGKMITAQAVCHDLEKNVRIMAEVSRRITNKQGVTFNEDMQIVTGNAAAKIAFRNAVFTVIPKAVTSEIQGKIKQVAIGSEKELKTRIDGMKKHFNDIGVTDEEMLKVVELKSFEEMTIDHFFTLRGLANAIKEGATDIDQAFGRTKGGKPNEEKIVKENEDLEQSALEFEKDNQKQKAEKK
jgi:hypothetical protein